MKTPKFLLLALFLVIGIANSIVGQHLGAYVDYTDKFYIFDNGKSTQIDHLAPQSYKVGGQCVLYVSSPGHLMMYKNGATQLLEKAHPSNYFATDFLAGYNIFGKLRVVHENKVITLSNRCTNYEVGDSIIAFYDKNTESLNVFYNGAVVEIESGMIGFPIQSWASGDNTIAYITSRNKDFKIWYQGENHTIARNVERTKFKAGKDIVAFIDELEQNFKVFYKGELYTIEDFIPNSYQVADGFVAYIDQMNEFKVFADGEVRIVSPYYPDKYLAKDNVLAFVEDSYFKAWYNGEVIEIESYAPDVFKVNWNTIAYLDNSNRMFMYTKGERQYLSNELVTDFEIYRDLIHIKAKIDRNIIFYRDKFYK